ncbi:MAG: TadE family protein [Candidatus Korobacteraceae bacterium]
MVEFALSLTVLLTLLFGIIDIGRALFAYNWLYNGARQATRWAMVRGSFCDSHLPGCPNGADLPTITEYVTNTLPGGYGNGLDTTGIDTGAVTVSSQCFATRIVKPNPPCAPTSTIQIQITYQFQFITPFLNQIKAWPMSSSSERVVQGSPTSN